MLFRSIHFLLEKDAEDSVPFLGISNWKLDAAKINRALGLTITDYDIQDLEETAISIAEAMDDRLTSLYDDFFKTLARTYNTYILHNQQEAKDNKDFHGNRDFYNLIKNAMRELIARRNEIKHNEKTILTEVGILSLERNFGGLENSTKKVKEIFKNELNGYAVGVLKIAETDISELKSPTTPYLFKILSIVSFSEILGSIT